MSAILPRSTWTDTANGRAGRGLDRTRVRGFTFHWPATPGVIGAVALSVVAGLLRTWRAQHIGRGWADIGYNYAIDQSGRIYFLTGLNRGAHAGGSGAGNSESVGILMVIGMGEEPTPAMLDAAAWLTAHLSGTLSRANSHWPHSHWTATQCCGDPLRRAISSGATRNGSGGKGGGGSTTAAAGGTATTYTVTTSGGRLNGRAGPGTGHRVTMTATNGYRLSIVETRNGWARSTGGHWYSMQYLRRGTAPRPAARPTTYIVNTRALPLIGRAGPGTNHRRTMTAAKGYRLSIVETRNGWAKSTGGHWYSMRYLRRA